MIDEMVTQKLVSELRCSVYSLNPQRYLRLMGINMGNVLHTLDYLSIANKNAGHPIDIQLTMIGLDGVTPSEDLQEGERLANSLGIRFKLYPYLDRAQNNHIITEKQVKKDDAPIIGCKLGYLRDRLAIWHDGIVALCCQDWRRENIVGNINDIPIQELWNTEKTQQYRDNIYSGKNDVQNLLCRKCALAIIGEIK